MPSLERTAADHAGQDASRPPIAARAPGAEADELA
ncbi:DNA-directed RNA polymerase sigma-70 factor, partial [Ralstonia pseudosolanacearum]